MSGPLFVGSNCRSRGGLSANEKEEKFALASNDIKTYYYFPFLRGIYLEGLLNGTKFVSGALALIHDSAIY